MNTSKEEELYDQLSEYQNKWMEIEQINEQLRNRIKELESTSNMKPKSSRSKSKRNLADQTRSKRQLTTNRKRLETAQEELELLRNRTADLEDSSSRNTDTFDTEGYFLTLYKETLLELQEEKDKHHQDVIELRTQLQNATEQLNKSRQDYENLRTTFDICKESLILEYEVLLKNKTYN